MVILPSESELEACSCVGRNNRSERSRFAGSSPTKLSILYSQGIASSIKATMEYI